MNKVKSWVRELANKVLDRQALSFKDALGLIRLQTEEEVMELVLRASQITRFFHGGRASFCSIINAKSGLCGEDCGFCAQSLRFKSGIKRYPLLDAENIIQQAVAAAKAGCREFCIVTSGRSLARHEFYRLLDMIRRIKQDVEIQVDVSVGFLDADKAQQLKAAGVTRVNHNLQTSARFYPRIATTHSYSSRTATLCAVRKSGLEICSGVILGLGETDRDRVQAAFELKSFIPECVPINILDPRPGTPLSERLLMHPLEIVKAIAVFRFILPYANLRLAGGRHLQLGPLQNLALRAGINGLIVGEYLTTPGGPIEEDIANLAEAGYSCD